MKAPHRRQRAITMIASAGPGRAPQPFQEPRLEGGAGVSRAVTIVLVSLSVRHA